MDGNADGQKKIIYREFMVTKKGLNSRSIMREAISIGIKYLTFFTFSTENWSRPKLEIDGLMKL